eukprot:CAMPEP_0201635614 /NCGR_PEP_ID=MMETSP0493-20130528/8089_1 /ASSEMBLY_ACC=CAM_ASM_000838 /TAXON_ID=420259 /ORGANISM="Thalassiosira gravida, Strain GMp14c1" /LENGTH=36 /DNA_ID= /DNA_START= /DNA_END= /DNA_ORIENTATION=
MVNSVEGQDSAHRSIIEIVVDPYMIALSSKDPAVGD